MKIYDTAGRLVKYFPLSTIYSLEPVVITWQGDDNFGQELPSGVYFCCVETNELTITKKIVKLR
jgi:flagellar hook assembly protein FlgD